LTDEIALDLPLHRRLRHIADSRRSTPWGSCGWSQRSSLPEPSPPHRRETAYGAWSLCC